MATIHEGRDAGGIGYTVPDSPADPETAAYELIVELPASLPGHHWPTRQALEQLATQLAAQRAFVDMTWRDARHTAAAILFDATTRDDGAAFLRYRAQLARTSTDTRRWDDPATMSRALAIAAQLLAQSRKPA
jgi:hypothetical protein